MDKVDDIRDFVATRIREGFDSVHDIIENATHYALEKYDRSDLNPNIKSLVADCLAAHRAEQSQWETSTDCDHLDEAFDALNRQGIVARQDFSCCNNCGFTEIWHEVEVEEGTRSVEGYVFFNQQCTEHAVKTGQLLLAYGCIEEDEGALSRIANRIVSELRRVGLRANWQGTAGHPIVVDGVQWKRRRT